MTAVFTRRRRFGDRQRCTEGKQSCEDGGRDWSVVSTGKESQGSTDVESKLMVAGGWRGRDKLGDWD